MSRPNVIVFFTDQQRWDSTGIHGNPLNLTPNFDRFCHTGTHVVHSFTCQPVCGPARACLQTGRYATQNGCYRNCIPLAPRHATLGQLFHNAGYDTAYFGKWHLAGEEYGPVAKEFRGGYQRWLASNLLEYTSDAYKAVLYDEEGKEVRLPGYRVDALTDAAIRYIAEPRERPFHLFVSFLEPHHQNCRDDYPAPDGYRERYQGRWTPPDLEALQGTAPQHLPGYWGMVKRLDEAFGRMMDALKSLNLLDNTIVLFTSDHACHFKTRNDEYKRSCHDSSLRVPTLFHGPGFSGGRQFQRLTSLVDLPPTLLEAAGLDVPPEMAGRSLFSEAEGAVAPEDDCVFAQISEAQHGRLIRTRRWKYAVSAPWTDSPQPEAYTESHLYDLEADPHELNNLVGLETFADVARTLREKLEAKMREIGEPVVPIHLAALRPAGQRSPGSIAPVPSKLG